MNLWSVLLLSVISAASCLQIDTNVREKIEGFALRWMDSKSVSGWTAGTVDRDPETDMNISQLITSKGYPCENHIVQTSDGFLLGVQRIPHGRTPGTAINRPAVFLQHGLLCSATNWVANLANESFAFILADSGFDVWLGNSRGNTYSRKHISLTPDMDAFWDWSWQDMAEKDLPAVINYILQSSQQSSLHYVGHSQGTLQAFAEFSKNQALAQKIKTVYALGPVSTVGHILSPIRYLSIMPDELMYRIFGKRDFLPNDELLKFLADTVCAGRLDPICYNILFLICGPDLSNLNQTRLPVYLSHCPSDTSVRDIVHFGQMVRSSLFQMYDYGSAAANEAHYGQSTPPLYNVTAMETPVVLYYAARDWLADVKDVELLIPKIKNLKGKFEIQHWNHLDFIWALDAPQLVYNHIISMMKSNP